MARRHGSRRWIAVSGGVLINGLILGALLMIEGSPPLVEEPPVLILELVSRSEADLAAEPRGGWRAVGGASAVTACSFRG